MANSDNTKDPNYEFLVRLDGELAFRILLSKKNGAPITEDDVITLGSKDRPVLPSRRETVHFYGKHPELTPKNIYFYDLGTRLHSSATAKTHANGVKALTDTSVPNFAQTLQYVELLFDAPGSVLGHTAGVSVPEGELDVYTLSTQHLQMGIDDPSVLATWDSAILSVVPNPLVKTTGPSRQIPSCLPIWYGWDTQPTSSTSYTNSQGYQNDIFDIEIYQTIPGTVLPNTRYREIVEAIKHVQFPGSSAFTIAVWAAMIKKANDFWFTNGSEEGAGETWNGLSLSSLTQINNYGFIKNTGRSTTESQIKIHTRLIYEPFDTGDTVNYKVTTGATYTSAAVPFSVKRGSDEIEIFLKPQWIAYGRRYNYSYARSITTHSYRTTAGSSPTKFYNRTSGVFTLDDTRIIVVYNASMQAAQGQTLTNFGPHTFTMDVYVNTETGVYSVTGLPDGDIGGTLPIVSGQWRLMYYGANYSLQIVANFWDPAELATGGFRDRHSTMNVAPQYTNVTSSISCTARVIRGVHIGRWPVFPRATNTNGWHSELTLNGTTAFTAAYDQSGSPTTKDYIPADARDFNGRVDRGNFSTADPRDIYSSTRHPNRDRNDYLYLSRAPVFNVVEDTTQTVDHNVGVRVATNTTHPIASSKATWDAEAATHIESFIVGSIESYAHMRPVTRGTITATMVDSAANRTIYALPLDAAEGLLAGVIKKNGTTYYVWRKTPQTRSGYDYNRDQGEIAYSGAIT